MDRAREDGGPRVLVVDDDADTADSLVLLLTLWGCRAAAAYDGRTGAGQALASRPDVVVLDLGLPGLDGYEVARRLRVAPGLEKVRLIAVSGFGGDEDRARSREAGFDYHLLKPVEPDVLRDLVTH
jgi:CheY-like chemotaxis protein